MKTEEFWKKPRKFDFATSISSFEHDGLGRYGDPISPNADLESMKRLKNIIKKGGLLFLTVPIGRDRIVWNLHRVYGKYRFPKLIEGWKLIDSFGFKEKDLITDLGNKMYKNGVPTQPVFVLRNI